MAKDLPRLRKPSLEDIKRTATPVAAPEAPPAGRAVEILQPVPAAPSQSGDERRLAAAWRILGRYRAWSIAAAASPLPFLDLVLISATQLRMIQRLAELYGVPFRRMRARSLLSALLGGFVPYSLTATLASAAAKLTPGLGTVVGITGALSSSVLATETIGRLFIQHFEAGGSLADFEPARYLAKPDGST